MSRIVIYTVNMDGTVLPWKEFRNAEPITSTVWTKIITQYREINKISSDQKVVIDSDEVMRIIKAGEIRLELCELAVIALTFDRVIVKREHFHTLALLIDQFISRHNETSRTNLVLQASTLRDLAEHNNIIGVCWQHGEIDPWIKIDKTGRKSESYNIYKDLAHWFMFVDGFVPPVRRKRERRLVKISINYVIEDEISEERLHVLAEQYRLFTANILNNTTSPIKVDVCKSNRI
jgi:hypothetical protein